MSARIEWEDEDIFSESYMDAFYKAHVASRRGNLDEDIAALEAEIRKVRWHQSRYRRYRYDNTLNSCGSSECSDDQASGDESDPFSMDASPTSVFKVYNSSSVQGGELLLPWGPDIFSWALLQQISHDHNYCSPESREDQTPIDHGTVSMKNVHWHLLSSPRRAQAVHKLSYILRHRPTDPLPPSLSSLSLLPSPLATSLRKSCSLGLASGGPKREGGGKARQTKQAHTRGHLTKTTGNQPHHLSGSSGGLTTRGRKRTRHSPYERPVRTLRHLHTEVTRVRNGSTCSEGEDPIVID